MSGKVGYFILLILLIYLSCTSLAKVDSNLQQLSDETFSEKTKEHEWSMVVFIRNWCTRSKHLMKEIDKAAEFIGKSDEKILWGKIDCETDGVKTCEKFSVSNVPALFLFKLGNYFKEFLLKPDYVGIIRFVRSEIGPGYSILDTDQDMEVFFESREVKLVGSFKKNESNLKNIFLNLVDDWKHQFDFGLKLIKDDEKEGITLYRPKHLRNKFEPDEVKYDGDEDAKQLENWMTSNKHGVVGHRHKYNLNDFEQPLVVVYFEVDYEKSPKTVHYWRNRVLKVAKSYPEYNFAISAVKDFHKEVVNFGYNFMRPVITPFVCSYINDKRYPMKEDFSVDEFSKYMSDLKENKIEMHIRSEEIKELTDGFIKIAVARNFDEIVNQSGKDTLIKFYATWCTWCNKLAPIWKKLAEIMKEEDVDIVKINAENNEIPNNYEVNQYPTIFWSPKNSKKTPIIYSGGKKLKNFIEFIAKHSTDELKGFDRNGKPNNETNDIFNHEEL